MHAPLPTKKQDTLWTAFSRQRQPPSKRQKLGMEKLAEGVVLRRKQSAVEPFRYDVNESADDEGDAGTVTDADLLSSQEDASSADFQGTRGTGACALGLDTAVHADATDDVAVLHWKKATYVVTEDSDGSPTKEVEGMQQTPKSSADRVGHLFSSDTAKLRLNEKKEVRLHLGDAWYLYDVGTPCGMTRLLGYLHAIANVVVVRFLISDSYKWTHEQGSIDMLDHLLAANHIDVAAYGLTDQDVVFIKELIIGGPLPGSDGALHGRPSSEQRFMYDIVNNTHSGLDVDKLDYFMRDALHTGAKMSCDPDLLIRNARVLVDRDDNEKKMAVCYPEKLVGQVMQAFHTRFELHQAVYQHKAVRAIEYMVCDIFLASNNHLTIKGKRFSEIMSSMEAYQHLDDRVLLKIQESEGSELEEARSILNRIYTGPYYNVIGKTAFTDHSYRKTEDMLLNEVLRCSKRRSLIDEKDGVILEFMRIHYGKGKDDPLKYVRFYSKNAVASTTCYPLPVAAYDMLSPRKFQERSIRILVKEPRLAAPVREAFERWSRKFNKSQVFPLELHTDRQML
ncbi:hypothetical protein BBJ28_00001947 [Nothophytophthora sp. Chile5]|nr:hypothetical protein BBJ28_00001947 [Nothophytophthora sp. Chile5]